MIFRPSAGRLRRWTRPVPVVPPLLLLLLSVAGGGCATGEQVYGGYAVGAPESLTPAAEDGRYEVGWTAAAGGPLVPVAGTRRFVTAGTPIGFATEPDGRVMAVAGAERIPLYGVGPEARHLAWSMPLRSAPARVAQAVFVAPLAAVGRLWGGGSRSDSNDGGGDPGYSSGDGGYYDSSYYPSSYQDRDDKGGGGGSARPESDRGYVPWASEPKVGR